MIKDLINLVISKIPFLALSEVNSAWSIMIHKGHGRPINSTQSYRCIWTWLRLAKITYSWIAKLKSEECNGSKTPTQFMSKGSSHELATLLMTELSRYSVLTLKCPMFCLYVHGQNVGFWHGKQNLTHTCSHECHWGCWRYWSVYPYHANHMSHGDLPWVR